MDRAELVNIAWQRGQLSYKLYAYQRQLYTDLWNAIKDEKCSTYVLNVSRRWGKSTIMCLIAIEFALRFPNSQIRFAAPTAKALKKITTPIFKMLLNDAPQEHKPRYLVQDNIWVFPNGSEIHMAGTDNQNYESLRGTTSHLNLMDEVGFMSELEYVLKSVLLPQTLTTGGKTLLASTPPKTPAHDFFPIAQEAEAEGFYKVYTIYDNKSLTPEAIAKAAKESGGIDSSTFKREYLCEFVVDEKSQIIPEWQDAYVGDYVKGQLDGYYHKYVSLDLGIRDFTAVLFGTYDFKAATLYIEHELTMSGHEMTTIMLRDAIKAHELTWLGPDRKPYRRISDNNNLQLLQDMGSLHGLHIAPTNKDTLDAMINEVRMLVGAGRLRVSPNCKMLLGCLKYGIWTERRDQFARSAVYKHFDHLAALVYLIRNLDQQTNPVPATHKLTDHTHYIPETARKSPNEQALKQIFGNNYNKINR